jgi:hypothetical protein
MACMKPSQLSPTGGSKKGFENFKTSLAVGMSASGMLLYAPKAVNDYLSTKASNWEADSHLLLGGT